MASNRGASKKIVVLVFALFLANSCQATIADGEKLRAAFHVLPSNTWVVGTDPCATPLWAGCYCLGRGVFMINLAGWASFGGTFFARNLPSTVTTIILPILKLVT